MNSEAELLQKLMVSKKIMDRHNEIGRGQVREMTTPVVEGYDAVPATYNIPQEFMTEQPKPIVNQNSNIPIEDRISKSKLPDEIKRLMMEHPIQQPTMGVGSGAVLSNELVEKASRLMNTNAKGDIIGEQKQVRQPQQQTQQSMVGLSANEIKQIVRETMEDVLSENGLLIESETKSSEMFKFRVGQHLFEGKVLKVKKMTK
jgi:hypothetical protein